MVGRAVLSCRIHECRKTQCPSPAVKFCEALWRHLLIRSPCQMNCRLREVWWVECSKSVLSAGDFGSFTFRRNFLPKSSLMGAGVSSPSEGLPDLLSLQDSHLSWSGKCHCVFRRLLGSVGKLRSNGLCCFMLLTIEHALLYVWSVLFRRRCGMCPCEIAAGSCAFLGAMSQAAGCILGIQEAREVALPQHHIGEIVGRRACFERDGRCSHVGSFLWFWF